jgi:hypothetical protein
MSITSELGSLFGRDLAKLSQQIEAFPTDGAGFARKVVFTTTDSSLRSLRISVISALNISCDYS